MRARKSISGMVIFAALLALATGILCLSSVKRPTGSPQLVSDRQLFNGEEMCQWPEATYSPAAAAQDESLFSSIYDSTVYAAEEEAGQTREITRPPTRQIRDLDPIYSGIAVNTQFNEIVLMDQNTWSIRVFSRTDNTPSGARLTEPKRVIQGPETEIQFNNGIYVDPINGEIYSVETDTGDKVVVFPRDAKGDVKPARTLTTPHRGFALAVDEEKQELFVGIQYPPEVAVYRKGASDEEEPLRSLQGQSTRLSDIHGIALDVKNSLMFVINWGHVSDYKTAGTGKFEDPSISVYPINADGDTAPLRVIQGPRTQLNWPAQMAIDPDSGNLYIANDMGQSVVVFDSKSQGDTAPIRVIQGNKTRLANPSGVAVDTRNKELWVSSFGNSSASAFPLTANGNVAPIRTIRSAPANKVSLKFGKVEALAYDEARDQIWVPN